MSRDLKIFFSVGDPSGDVNCSSLVSILKKNYPKARLAGLAGPRMIEAGCEPLFDFSRCNCMGYWEVIKQLPFFLKLKSDFFKSLELEKPDLLICVDYSGFNKPLMKKARSLGIPVLWFIAPMIWMWKKQKHGPALGRYASHIATIFPFEPDHWREFTDSVSFVGSPIAHKIATDSALSHRCFPDSHIRLALVPGSRTAEVRHILPVQLRAALELKNRLSPRVVEIKVSKTEYLPDSLYKEAGVSDDLLFRGDLGELLTWADTALVTSGTATLQAALYRVPSLICYKTSSLSYHIVRSLLPDAKYIGLPNLIKDSPVFPEFIQSQLLSNNLVSTLEATLSSQESYMERVAMLNDIHEIFDSRVPEEELLKIVKRLLEEPCEVLL